ncbi:GNAT family N-acetyltransferase [Jeotgalibacillus campisalis]|uniref:N-acetyltransferase n=1 Tax=Jeotgalibacillus campisalis TaxID=220754 RepID=A0A0C2RL03_9BACL|nr:GNAT family N-acetyltransferase [Jeotgalibacillus campisalis]KIL50920.1 N-acetyltransferase [Jeotgalibacillus campisalis]
MKIIEAAINDKDGITELFNEYRMFYGKASNKSEAALFIEERLENQDSTIFAVKKGEQFVGFVQLYPTFSSISMKRAWILNDLFVLKEARKQGVAQMLLDQALLLCKKTNAMGLSLQTAPDNLSAQKLYEKNGFKRDEEFYTYSLMC